MSTPFNSVSYRTSLEKLRNYVANTDFISDIGWKADGYGHVLCNKYSREETVCIMVGKVSRARLNTGPAGNYNPQFNNPFHKAKYQLTLVMPDEPAFVYDFQASILALEKAQEAIASTEESAYMIIKEGEEKSIRFSAPIFTKRDKQIVSKLSSESQQQSETGVTSNSDGDNVTIDEETEKWPVPQQFVNDMEAIKTSHTANPLKVYMGNQFVEPLDVTNALDSALVEVQFTIQHYRINSRKPVVHSFSALVQQILILKRAPGRSSPYKRKDYRKGPIIMPVSPHKQVADTPGGSGSGKDVEQVDIERVKIVVPGNGIGTSAKSMTVLDNSERSSQIIEEGKKKSGDKFNEEGDEGTEVGAQDDSNQKPSEDENDHEITAKKQKRTHIYANDNATKRLEGSSVGDEENSVIDVGMRMKRRTTSKNKATTSFQDGPIDNKE